MAMAAGAVLRIAGGITGGIAADKRRERWEDFMNSLKDPDTKQLAQDWFDEMNQFYEPANKLSQRAREDELTQNLALRERAIPGFAGMVGDASRSIAPLLRGELPQGVMDAFSRAGGASTAGLGFGGSNFGALNTGLFGARGSLGAIQTGMGLLPTLMSTMPNISAPTTMGLLGQLLTPMQRVNMQMQLRQQKIGMQETLESMPTSLESWSAHLNESGAMLLGGGGAAMGGGGASGTGGFSGSDWGMGGGGGAGSSGAASSYGGGAGMGWAGGGAF